jgi:hypothetical protein
MLTCPSLRLGSQFYWFCEEEWTWNSYLGTATWNIWMVLLRDLSSFNGPGPELSRRQVSQSAEFEFTSRHVIQYTTNMVSPRQMLQQNVSSYSGLLKQIHQVLLPTWRATGRKKCRRTQFSQPKKIRPLLPVARIDTESLQKAVEVRKDGRRHLRNSIGATGTGRGTHTPLCGQKIVKFHIPF